MSISIAPQFTQRYYRWTDWKAVDAIKHFIFQYDNEDEKVYTIWGYDGPEVHIATIWKGDVPDSVISAGYSQAQNDSDKSDFETNYKPNGNEILATGTVGNPIIINPTGVTGQPITGTVTATLALGIPDPGNSTTTPLAPNAVFTGTSFDTLNYPSFNVNVKFVASGAVPELLEFQWSPDGTNWDTLNEVDIHESEDKGLNINHQGRYFRIKYTNSGTAHTEFRLSIFHEAVSASTDNIQTVGGLALNLGQTTNDFSLPVTIASDQTPVPVSGTITANAGSGTFGISGTVTANIGTTNGLALDATLTGGTQTSRLTDGTNTATVTGANALKVDGSAVTQPISGTVTANQGGAPWSNNITEVGGSSLSLGQKTSANSLPVVLASDQTINVTASEASLGLNNNPVPTSSTQVGGSDGTNLQALRVFDLDTGAGTEYDLGVSLRLPASGGSVVGGTSANPLRIDPTGTTTQPVSGTITANIGNTNGLALDATLTGGTQTSRLTDGTNTATVTGANALKVDGSAVTQPVSSTQLPSSLVGGRLDENIGSWLGSTAPTVGQKTSANSIPVVLASDQTITVTASEANVGLNGSPIPTSSALIGASDGTNLQQLLVESSTNRNLRIGVYSGANEATVTGANALKVDGSAVTQPVSGTITSNIGTTNGLALDATVSALQVSQGSTTSGQKGGLTLGAVTTAAPSYTTAQTSPLSLTTAGALRTDSSATTQPVSGTVTANQGGSWTTIVTQATAANLNATVTGTVAATQSGSWTVTSNIGTTNGLALDATLTGGTQTSRLTDGTNTATVTGANALKVDGSAVTQPVSGTVTANQGGSWTVQQGSAPWSFIGTKTNNNAAPGTNNIGTLSAIANASAPSLTEGNLVALSTDLSGNLRVAGSFTADTGTADKTTFTYGTSIEQPIGGVFQDTSPTLTAGQSGAVRLTNNRGFHVNLRDASGNEKLAQQISANSIPVVLASDQSVIPVSQSGSWTNTVTQTTAANLNATVVGSGNFTVVQATAANLNATVSGTVTSNIGTTNGLALDATLTGGTQTTRLTDGTNTATVKAASTAAVATDKALVVAISPNNTVAATQSGSWTVTSNIGTTNGLALDTTVSALQVSQGSTTSGEKGPLIQGAVTTAAPSYTTAQTSPLSLTTAGALRTDSSATTQPISGTITANAGSGTFAVSGTVTANQGGTWTVQPGNTANTTPWLVTDSSDGTVAAGTAASKSSLAGLVFNTSLPTLTNGQQVALQGDSSGRLLIGALPTGANTIGAVTQASGPWTSNITQIGGASLALGQTTMAASIPVTFASNQSTLTISGTVTSNIGTTNGLALDATLAKLTISQGTALGTNTQAMVGGSVTTAAPSYTTGQISPLSLTTAGALRTDSSATTQPISGTVTSNIGTTNGLALDATVSALQVSQGSTTSGEKGPLIQGAVTTAAPSYTTAQTSPLSLTTSGLLRIDGSGATQPISGTVTANAGSGTFIVAGGKSNNSVVPGSTNLGVLPALANAAAPSLTEGNQVALSTDLSGNLRVTGSFTADTGVADKATFTYGTSIEQPIGGVFQDTSPTLTAGQSGAVRLTNNRAFHVNIRDASGNEKLAQQTSANSIPVVIASDQSAITVSQATAANLNATLVGTKTNNNAAPGATNIGTLSALANAAAPSWTEGNQVVLSTLLAGALRTDNTSWLGSTAPTVGQKTMANSIPITFASDQSTLTISGTVTANIGTTNGLALDATVSALQVSQGSTTSGQKGGLTLGAVTTAAPSYTTAQTSPLSLTTAGALRTDNTSWLGSTAPSIGQKAMASSIPVVIASDQTRLLTPQDITFTDVITALNGTVSLNPTGCSGATITITGAWVATLSFEATGDGTNYFSINANAAGVGTLSSSTTVNGFFRVNAADYLSIRVRASAFTSGTATINIYAGAGLNTLRVFQTTASSLQSQSQVTDGTNIAAVKAASTAAVATDPALVVTMSPNSSAVVSQVDTTASGTLNALNATASIALAGKNSVGFQLSAGTLVGTIVPEVSFDGGTTWIASFFDDPTTTNIVSNIVFGSSNTATARTIVGVGGASNARVRVSAFTSGTATCNIRATNTNDPSELYQSAAGAVVPPSIAQVGGSDGTNLRALNVDTSGRAIVKLSDGTSLGTIKAASTAAIATDTALVVAISPNSNAILGTKTNNNAAPGATNIGTLSALANAAAPSFTEGNQVTLSTDLAGNLRTTSKISGKLSPLYGTNNQTLTITLASLATAGARASTAVDNTTNIFEDVLFFVKFTTAAASTSTTGYVNIYGYGTVDGGTTYPEAITGTDAGITLTSPPNLVLLAQINAVANAHTYTAGPFSFCRMYGLDRLPAKWGLVFVNQSGATLNATAGNHAILYQGVNGQIA